MWGERGARLNRHFWGALSTAPFPGGFASGSRGWGPAWLGWAGGPAALVCFAASSVALLSIALAMLASFRSASLPSTPRILCSSLQGTQGILGVGLRLASARTA